jgi:hypothetical protein
MKVDIEQQDELSGNNRCKYIRQVITVVDHLLYFKISQHWHSSTAIENDSNQNYD